MTRIYELRKDREQIEILQRASLNDDGYGGLARDQGLVGTDEWWRAIERGDLPRQVVEGTISKVFMSGRNDYPQFEIDSDGVITDWTRDGDDAAYQVGRKIRVEYVLAKYKPHKVMKNLTDSRLVLAIDIDLGP